jgi:tetratricopeptide (TPR) repeat protein
MSTTHELDALIGQCEREERWNRLVEALKEKADSLSDPAEKVKVLLRVADVCRDRLGLDAMVVNALNRALEADPTSSLVLDRLEVQYTRMARWVDVIAVLKKKCALEGSATPGGSAYRAPGRRPDLTAYLKLAEIYWDRFSHRAEAAKAVREALAIDPDDPEARRLSARIEGRR